MVNRSQLGAAVALVVAFLLFAANAHAALVGYWDFNEGSGTTLRDFSPNNNNGTFGGTHPTWQINGGATSAPGDNSLRFSGGTTFVTVPHSPSLANITNQFTIGAWVYEHGNTNYGHILVTTNNASNRNWLWQTDSSGGGDQNYIWSTTVGAWQKPLGFTNPNNVWRHYTFTYDGTLGSNQLKAYVNGNFQSQYTISGSANFPTFSGAAGVAALYIGGWLAGGSSYNGRIDDVVIFNSVETDFAAIMAGTHPDMVRANWLAGQEWSKRISIGRTSGAAYNAVYSTTNDATPGGPTVGVLVDGGTTARLWGTGTASSATTVNMQWRARYESELELDDGGLVSDVLDLTGIAALGGGATDEFVLAMSYQSSLPAYLAYWDAAIDEWIPAVDGNFGGTANYLGETAFLAGTHGLGDYGYQYDAGNDTWYAWAVLNHNSQFAVFAVPEPGTWLLLLSAFACGALLRRRR